MKSKKNKNAELENTKVEEYWNQHEHEFIELLKDHIVLPENILTDILPGDYKPIWLVQTHPIYIPSVLHALIQDKKLFIKGLYYAVTNERHEVARYIYAQCKHREIRNMDINSIDRFDGFCCMIASDTGTYRHQGTKDGCIKVGTLSDKTYKERNKELFLRVLQHGPTNSNNPLICSVDGRLVENIPNYNPSSNKYMPLDEFDLHHAKFTGNTSYYYDYVLDNMVKKVEEPSQYVNKWLHYQFTTKMISEMMSCIVISTAKHTSLHKFGEKIGGIDFWINGWTNNHYASIPYAWRSAENYTEILEWISKNCPLVDIKLLPSYEKFIQLHNHLSIISSQDLYSMLNSRIETIQQTPTPCIEVIVQHETPVLEEIQPTSLCVIS